MKKVILGFVVASMVFSSVAFAQTAAPVKPAAAQVKVAPAPVEGQAEWSALMKKQGEARKALNEQLNAEKEAFLAKHPALAAKVAEQVKAAKERADKKKAAEQK